MIFNGVAGSVSISRNCPLRYSVTGKKAGCSAESVFCTGGVSDLLCVQLNCKNDKKAAARKNLFIPQSYKIKKAAAGYGATTLNQKVIAVA